MKAASLLLLTLLAPVALWAAEPSAAAPWDTVSPATRAFRCFDEIIGAAPLEELPEPLRPARP